MSIISIILENKQPHIECSPLNEKFGVAEKQIGESKLNAKVY